LKRILIFYSHFSPAFKAGGPVQSLVNLVNALHEDFEFYVFCGAYEMGDRNVLSGIKPDTWNSYSHNVQVYYATNSIAAKISSAIERIDPDFIYVNGIFLLFYNTLPLWRTKTHHKKIVVAPRGMLQAGALAIKPLKKKLFLLLLKTTCLLKNVIWHATDDQEAKDIKKIIDANAFVRIASNIPKAIPNSIVSKEKVRGKMKLVYLSLITEKKNIHVVLQALLLLKTSIEFDIYGPIKDDAYWMKCEGMIKGQIHDINYRGPINPNGVQETLSKYHAFILPTKGENFGHAIYESLSVGTPVLITPFTPWGRLQDFNAGKFIDFNDQEYSIYSKGAFGRATDYFSKNDFKTQYQNLFS